MAKLIRNFGKSFDNETIKTYLTYMRVGRPKSEDRSKKLNLISISRFLTSDPAEAGFRHFVPQLPTSDFRLVRTISLFITSLIDFSILI